MKRALVFSALGKNSGCALRARYLCRALRRQGFDARLALPLLPNLPFSIEAFLSAPRFAFIALMWRADIAVGIKPYPNCWLALWIAKLRGAKAVADVDDWDGAWRGGLSKFMAELAQAPAFRLLDFFSTHHPAIAKKLAGKGRVLRLGQGVDTLIFRAWPAKKHSKLLLFTAHLNVACQLELLMEWVGPWLERHPDWRLRVAGGGPDLERYRRRYASRQVGFSGQLSPEASARAIAGARICLAAYAPGGGNAYRVPMKAGEYLAVGRPVATNLISGLADLKPYLYASKPGAKPFGAVLDRLASGRGDGREKRGSAWIRKARSWDALAAGFVRELE